jgi:hypothetical protein
MQLTCPTNSDRIKIEIPACVIRVGPTRPAVLILNGVN